LALVFTHVALVLISAFMERQWLQTEPPVVLCI